jgi:hypothetical protein
MPHLHAQAAQAVVVRLLHVSQQQLLAGEGPLRAAVAQHACQRGAALQLVHQAAAQLAARLPPAGHQNVRLVPLSYSWGSRNLLGFNKKNQQKDI